MNNLYESEIKKLADFLHDIIGVKKLCNSKRGIPAVLYAVTILYEMS